ncbi:MAG TPA: S8 family serine peptidase [Terriglobales bacterium]|nr:S8 family serine peptidase [Terriglobales bacterium]
MRSFRLMVVSFSLMLLAAVGFLSTPVPAFNSPKIAPRILSDTAHGAFTEALVVLREQADLRPAATLTTKLEKGRFVFETLRSTADRSQAPIRAFLEQHGIAYQSFYIVNMIRVTANLAALEQLAARDDVDRIDANPYVRASLPTPTGIDNRASDNPDTVEWNVQRVGAPTVWSMGFRGEGLVVAGNDTGVQWDHPALKNHYRGWNGSTVDHDYNWHDATSQHSPTPIDPNDHGTFTASQMVGDDGAGNQVGVAPGAKWIACRNMDANGTGSPAQYTECFEFLVAPYPVNGNPSQGNPALAPDSINNSWSCPPSEGCSTNTLLAVVNAVRAAGIFPAMAATNSGPSCSTVVDPPSLYASSVSVGSTNKSDAISSFSSRGPVTADGSNRLKPDLSAPGENIRGAVPGGGYQSGWSGTSMATPEVAGGVALLWQAKPNLAGNITGTENTLTHTSRHMKSTQNCGGSGQNIPNNVFGWGILNIAQAVKTP